MSANPGIDNNLIPPSLRAGRAAMQNAALAAQNIQSENEPDNIGEQNTDANAVTAEIQKLQQRVNTLGGMLKAKDREIKDIRDATNKPQEPTITVDDYALALEPINLSDEEKTKYANSQRFIESVVADVLRRGMAPILTRLTQLERNVKTVEITTDSKLSSTSKASYEAALAGAVPDLQELVMRQEFESFLAENVPMLPGVTIQQVLDQAQAQMNVPRIRGIMDEFRKKYVKGTDTRNPFRQPTAGAGYTPPANNQPGRQQTFRMSERSTKWDLFRSGAMTEKDWKEFTTKFDAAAKAGLVDYSS